jgi:hypothetical protein
MLRTRKHEEQQMNIKPSASLKQRALAAYDNPSPDIPTYEELKSKQQALQALVDKLLSQSKEERIAAVKAEGKRKYNELKRKLQCK